MKFVVSINSIDIKKISFSNDKMITIDCKHDFLIMLSERTLSFICDEYKKAKDKSYKSETDTL
jgi:hypothetical protein